MLLTKDSLLSSDDECPRPGCAFVQTQTPRMARMPLAIEVLVQGRVQNVAFQCCPCQRILVTNKRNILAPQRFTDGLRTTSAPRWQEGASAGLYSKANVAV